MKYLFSLLLLTGVLSLQAQEPAYWDLKSCVEYAIQHNISIQQADVSARLAKIQAELANSNRLPTVNGSTGMGMRFGRSIDPTTNGFSNTQFLYNNFGLNGGVQLYNAAKRSLAKSLQQQQATRSKTPGLQPVLPQAQTLNRQQMHKLEDTWLAWLHQIV